MGSIIIGELLTFVFRFESAGVMRYLAEDTFWFLPKDEWEMHARVMTIMLAMSATYGFQLQAKMRLLSRPLAKTMVRFASTNQGQSVSVPPASLAPSMAAAT